MTVLNITEEAITLGEEYMSKGAIPASEPEDAYHIAIATINGIEALASWNFKLSNTNERLDAEISGTCP